MNLVLTNQTYHLAAEHTCIDVLQVKNYNNRS